MLFLFLFSSTTFCFEPWLPVWSSSIPSSFGPLPTNFFFPFTFIPSLVFSDPFSMVFLSTYSFHSENHYLFCYSFITHPFNSSTLIYLCLLFHVLYFAEFRLTQIVCLWHRSIRNFIPVHSVKFLKCLLVVSSSLNSLSPHIFRILFLLKLWTACFCPSISISTGLL